MKIRIYTLRCLILCVWILTGFTWGDSLARKTKKGNELFDAGRYEEALQEYTDADVNSKGGDSRLPKLYKNLGNTHAQLGNHEQATEMYKKAIEASDNAGFKADTHYNSGNVWMKQQQYEQALAEYEQALKLNEEHREALQNRDIAAQLVEQQNEQQEQQQDQEKNQNQEKQDDQQEQQQQNQDQEKQDEQDEQQSDQEQQQEDQQEQEQQQAEEQDPEEQQAAEAQESPEDKEQQLSEEEALRILDALKEKEQLMQQQKQVPPRPVEKDW